MKNTGITWLFVGMLAVTTCEVLLHWALGKGLLPMLLSAYLSTDVAGRYFFAGVVDNVAPAAVLGCVNGWVGFPRRSLRQLLPFTIGLAAFAVAIMPIYGTFVGHDLYVTVWGDAKHGVGAFSYVFRFFSAFLVAYFFTNAAYLFRRDWKRKRPMNLPKQSS